MVEIIFLDLDAVKPFGWEGQKSDLVIDSIIRGINAGDNFPAVYIEKIDDENYQLTPDYYKERSCLDPDGGHNRAVGHYIAGRPLKCFLVGNSERREGVNINIIDTIITDDREFGFSFYDHFKRKDPNYR